VQPPADYVYGIVAAGTKAPSGPGIGGTALRLVSSDGVAALVSDVPADDLRFGRAAMVAHSEVLERAMANGTILPTRFGVVLEGDDAVRESLLDPHLDVLLTQLEDFAGKAELKLRGSYEERRLMSEVLREDQDVARLRDSLRGTAEDASYYGRIRLGELVADAVERKRQLDARVILDRLAPLALAVDVAEPNHERVVFNASFLVERERIEAFDVAVDEIGRAQADRIRFKYTGPLPPHSFVRLETERQAWASSPDY
jgi:Gas vesicle synthesis protein GvpL/GvpF